VSAPTFTERQEPVGVYLCDGHRTLISFAADPDVSFWEITVKPPGADGGEPIDSTTMHNNTWRTVCLRQLKTLTAATGTAAYDPQVLTQLVDLINNATSITVHNPDGSAWVFWGALTQFDVQDRAEGTLPIANFTVTPTNQDPTTGDEEGPVYVPPGSGTPVG
jgi:hypothetical protein